MKRALVLSGGGAKGAYEMGVWKALRKLDINIDIVTGTSIGALNAAMMVQNDYSKCLKTWYYMNYDYVSKMEIKGKYSTSNGRKEIISKYAKGALKGGLEMDGLKDIINNSIDEKKFFNSRIDFGLVTTYFPSFKGKYVYKKDMSEDNLKKYLLASASCFPAFKPTKIGNSTYIDGGYTDNLPINMAIEMGANEIIAVNMRAFGIIKSKLKKNVPITYIKPTSKLGSLLVFEKDYTRQYMKIGYNDTMKVYKKLEGNNYTFKLGSLKRNYDRNFDNFSNLVNNYYNGFLNIRTKKIKSIDEYNNILETLMEAFNIDYTKIYRTSHVNVLLRNLYYKNSIKSNNTIKKAIKNNSIRKAFISSELICYICDELKNKKNKNITNLRIMFPKAFLCAIYLKSILK